jgi:hypothetical protein
MEELTYRSFLDESRRRFQIKRASQIIARHY